MKTKICTCCSKRKKLKEFYYNERYKGSYKSECIKCNSEKSKERYLKRRGVKKCKCGAVLEFNKEYCEQCRYEVLLSSHRKCQRKLREKVSFRKKESIRKALWYQKRKKLDNTKKV